MMSTVISILAFVVAIAAHELAHAWAALALGDTTARSSGRMTLNPIAHIDIFGTVIIPVVLILTRFPVIFGWAKPIPVDPSNFVSPRKGMMLTSAAGPLANFLLAGIFSLLFKTMVIGGFLPRIVGAFLIYSIMINVVLGLFNLIPIPPLDGSNILAGFLPREVSALYMKTSKYGFWVLAALLYLGVFEKIVMPLAVSIMRFLAG